MIAYAGVLDPFDPREIEAIYEQVRMADYDKSSRRALLERLGFVPADFAGGLAESVKEYLSVRWAIALSLAAFVVLGSQFAGWVLAISSAVVAYDRWEKGQRDRNVDDALHRKDRANQVITQQPELLLPYVGNVFDVEVRTWQGTGDIEDQVKVEMFVFLELDNLEFVFDKSRARLIETEYTVRAVKIFLARSENPHFEQLARRLVLTGRYSEDFVRCVQKLLSVGSWGRTQNS